ncbi:uncharacterized protein BDW43DRAFT_152683 [Aspergillus alliaceus]|uniref:uncharacterized protein n=1 Tax=Petromyces alliaceus TaxID=209559 RepID=UPI0012A63F71|nr:uncharacterized protein BDW43DRAFT_152683 [Aspergillus alliaceus]KAB8238076.1 hypothetical protein BDW43DRAFT_152683 [Aspergillus alliaceus]
MARPTLFLKSRQDFGEPLVPLHLEPTRPNKHIQRSLASRPVTALLNSPPPCPYVSAIKDLQSTSSVDPRYPYVTIDVYLSASNRIRYTSKSRIASAVPLSGPQRGRYARSLRDQRENSVQDAGEPFLRHISSGYQQSFNLGTWPYFEEL